MAGGFIGLGSQIPMSPLAGGNVRDTECRLCSYENVNYSAIAACNSLLAWGNFSLFCNSFLARGCFPCFPGKAVV